MNATMKEAKLREIQEHMAALEDHVDAMKSHGIDKEKIDDTRAKLESLRAEYERIREMDNPTEEDMATLDTNILALSGTVTAYGANAI